MLFGSSRRATGDLGAKRTPTSKYHSTGVYTSFRRIVLLRLAVVSRIEKVTPMSDQSEDLILVHLCWIDSNIQRLGKDMSDIKVLTTNIETGLAGVNRRLDRLEVDVGQIKRCLDQVQA